MKYSNFRCYKSVVFFVLAVVLSTSFAQQLPVHSGYNINPYLYNPAVGGAKPYVDFRLQHKNQWLGIDGAPSTQLLSGHSSIDKRNYGLGAIIYNDKSGVLSNTGVSLSYSYHLKLSKQLKLSFGVLGSIAQYRINRRKVILVHKTDNLLDVNNTANTISLNAGAGLYLYNENNFYVGLSALNLIPTKIDYQNGAITPQVGHYYFTMAKLFYFGESFSLQPTVLLNYIEKNPLMVDFRVRGDYNETFQLELGYRLKDGLIAGFGVYPHPDFGINYNYNLSLTSMRTGNYGSHEIMLNYIFYYKPIYKLVRRRYKWINRKKKETGSEKSTPQLE